MSDAGDDTQLSNGEDVAGPSKSLNAKRLRQAAENDVQFLANRIAKLKAEELKARKEIDKTRGKTKEITSNKKVHTNKMVDKTEIREQVINSKKEERVHVSLNKNKQIEAVFLSRQRILKSKKTSVDDLRKLKKINEARIVLQREEERERNIKRREEIQHQQEFLKVKRVKEMQEKNMEVRKLYEEKIAREELERDRQEKLATQLVAQEAQLIYRLKQLHQEKQSAIRELANAVDCLKADQVEKDIEGDAAEDDQPAGEIQQDLE